MNKYIKYLYYLFLRHENAELGEEAKFMAFEMRLHGCKNGNDAVMYCLRQVLREGS